MLSVVFFSRFAAVICRTTVCHVESETSFVISLGERVLDFCCALVTSQNFCEYPCAKTEKKIKMNNLLVSSTVATFYVNSSDCTIYVLLSSVAKAKQIFDGNHPERDFHFFYGLTGRYKKLKKKHFLFDNIFVLFYCYVHKSQAL